jgi:hypothetical protein
VFTAWQSWAGWQSWQQRFLEHQLEVAGGSGNHPGGEQLAEFDSEFLTAGDPGCLERVRGRPMAVREAVAGTDGVGQPA